MELYAFDITTARNIEQHASQGAFVSPLVRGDAAAFSLVCIRVEAGGVLGRHPAVDNQLFFVVEGRGVVSGEGGVSQPIEAGQMAFWAAGEAHETRSENGLTALVIEGVGLSPHERLRLLYRDPEDLV